MPQLQYLKSCLHLVTSLRHTHAHKRWFFLRATAADTRSYFLHSPTAPPPPPPLSLWTYAVFASSLYSWRYRSLTHHAHKIGVFLCCIQATSPKQHSLVLLLFPNCRRADIVTCLPAITCAPSASSLASHVSARGYFLRTVFRESKDVATTPALQKQKAGSDPSRSVLAAKKTKFPHH